MIILPQWRGRMAILEKNAFILYVSLLCVILEKARKNLPFQNE